MMGELHSYFYYSKYFGWMNRIKGECQMNQYQQDELIREYPISLWIPAFIFFAGGIFTYFRRFPIGVSIGGVAIGLLLVVLSMVLVVRLDRGGRVLTVQRIGLVRRSIQELAVSEIQAVVVQQSQNRDRDSGPTYRVVIVMENGEAVPLRSYYSSGYQSKEETAQRLREAIGVEGHDQTPQGVLEMASQFVQGVYQPDGVGLGEMEEQETNGVRWQMQTVALGASPVTRWLSKDFTYPDQFLYLVQKIENKDGGGIVMNLMGNTLMRQSLRIYGFSDADLPNIEDAVVLDEVDNRLDKYFMGYASDELDAPGLINTWVVDPLLTWAEAHPMRQGRKQREDFSQLAVLFSPNGVYLSCLGELTEDETEQLVNLGVEVVRALG
jgi:hypothetical protein